MWEHVQYLRRVPKSWTRRTMTPYLIPSYVILTRAAKHGASERQRMLLQSQGDVAENSPTQTWWVQNHIGKMAQW